MAAQPKRKNSAPRLKGKPAEPAFDTKHWWVFGVLIAINLISYAPVLQHGFVNYDDPQYVSANPAVAGGLTSSGVVWAFTTGHESNWHPITWLSHMLDIQLFGLNPAAHHAVNLAFHIGSTLLLFWFLSRATGALWPSAFTAALFAIHPLHVESVVWIAERKDVLSTFLGMVTLCAYLIYARKPQLTSYLAVFGLLALALMAKPMLVTLPFLLLLLDYWPLRRLKFGPDSNLARLIAEKLPLILLIAASSVITFIVQKEGGSMGESLIPIGVRIANACTAYFVYAWRMIWPARLAVLYPVVWTASPWWLPAALGLVALSTLAVVTHRSRPYLAVGWFWYVGTLVPVIGLVQVGRQAVADRYTYLPLIGLFVIVAFGIAELFAASPAGKLGCVAAGAVVIMACMFGTRSQLEYWSSSEALWQHTLNVTADNALAHNDYGTALEQAGKVDEAIAHYSEAARIEPEYAAAHYNLAAALLKSGKSGRDAEAAGHLLKALSIEPDFAEAHNTLGAHYLAQGKFDEAIRHLTQAVSQKPEYPVAHNNLCSAFAQQGRTDDAIAECIEAVRLDPGYVHAHNNAGILLAQKGRTSEAVAHFTEVLRINSDNPVAQTWLRKLKANDAQ